MLRALAVANKPVAVATIYDAIPGLGPAEHAALTANFLVPARAEELAKEYDGYLLNILAHA